MIPLRFTPQDLERANAEWGCNCGPGSVAAIMGLTLDELRPHLGDFERKRYTNPTLMWDILRNVGARWFKKGEKRWPAYGLARIQWEGPWTAPGVPARAAYRHTHWVAVERAKGRGHGIFDINAMNSGGWVSEADWAASIVPFILEECVPKASGGWHITHAIEIDEPGT